MSKSKKADSLTKLANQFRCPDGEQGIVVADSMNATNFGMITQTIKALSLIENDTILELGHGNAKHITQIFEIQDKLKYTGLDISPLMHQEAINFNTELIAQQKVHFELFNGTEIPLLENSFSKIFTVNTIYFWEKPEIMMSELYRVLSPNGLCCITFAHKEFLEQLPFVQNRFTLYDLDKIKEISKHSPFKNITELNHSEQIPDNNGMLVERNYTIVVFKK